MVSKDSLTGRQLANFHVIRLLGRGGMAEVYYGWDIKLQRPVAVKVIDARYRDNPEYAERFVQEARALAAWHHPNIVQIYYADENDGYYFYVMEYIAGLDLDKVIDEYTRRQELVPIEDVLHIGRSAAEALDYAHRHGFIHRDVKPSNLIIAGDGRVVLTDFGLAMNIEQGTLGQVFGSPHYIAPEQARNSAQAVPQSDLYSLGVILYEMLAGAVPFNDPSPTALALQHLTQEPPLPRQHNPLLNQDVEIVLLRALRKSPGERYQSGRALMDALEQAVNSPAETTPFLPFSGRPPGPGGEVKKQVSQVPVAEIVAQHLKKQPALPQEIVRIPPLQASRRAPLNRTAWWGIGCGALLLLFFLMIAAIAWAGNPLAGLVSAFNPTETLAPVSSPSSVPVLVPTQTPSQTPTSTATATTTPTETSTETPTATLTPTPSPTPNGFHFQLFYDQTSFYLLNLLGGDRPVNALSFERLDKHGKVTSTFDRSLWGEETGTLQEGDCLMIKLLDYNDFLDPPECRDHQTIVATSYRNQDYIFWTKDKDSRQFRVLWEDVELGTCQISENSCEILYPKPP